GYTLSADQSMLFKVSAYESGKGVDILLNETVIKTIIVSDNTEEGKLTMIETAAYNQDEVLHLIEYHPYTGELIAEKDVDTAGGEV
ncbi:hypothetical protein, partial [Klebsiella pneumoniae]